MTKIYDVTVPLSASVPTYPGDPRSRSSSPTRMAAGSPYNLARFTLGAHAGTHVDAPFHFLADGATVDQLPLEILMGKARVVEIPARERIDREDLEALDLRDDLRVLLKTRMSGQLRVPEFQEDFVYLTGDARRLPRAGGIKLVGIDYLSVETLRHHGLRGPPRAARAPASSSSRGSTSRRSSRGSTTWSCLPLRIVGADGAPRRRVVLRDAARERPPPARRGGGAPGRAAPGERLYPLTRDRAKPAVSFGGPYRIVDFTLSQLHQLRPAQDLHRHPVQGPEPEPPRPHGLERR